MFGFHCAQRSAGSIHVSDGLSLRRLELHPEGVPDFGCRKWFLQALGHDGLNNLLAGYENKSAEAICTFAYCAGPGNEPLIFQGRVSVGRGRLRCEALESADPSLQGKIVPARGSLDFGTLVNTRPLTQTQDNDYFTDALGWDPIFEYMGETFAEMDKVKKNGLSHRFLALSKLKDWLKQS